MTVTKDVAPDDGVQSSRDTASDAMPKAKPKPSIRMKLQSIWAKSGLKTRQLKTMFKGAWPPVIALALYQYDSFEATFPTLGYLVAIASVLSMAFLPRARFFEGMMFSLTGVAIGLGIALLSCFCAIQARLATSDPTLQADIGASGARQATEYNSSASAVAAIFLFFNILAANALRFSRPQFQVPIILYSIFANIAGTFAPTFASMTGVYIFVRQLTTAFLSGFAIAIVCHVFIFPTSSRDVVQADMKTYFVLLQKVLNAEREYLESMESADVLHETIDDKGKTTSRFQKASAGLKGSIATLSALHAKIQTTVPYAKREIAYGHFSAKDIGNLFTKLRQIYLPVLGLSSVADIFQRLVTARNWKDANDGTDQNPTTQAEVTQWNEIMRALHDPFEHVIKGISGGLEHISYRLKFAKPAKPGKDDVERDPSTVRPGDAEYLKHLEEVATKFWDRRAEALKVWCIQKNIPFLDFNPATKESTDTQLARIFSGDDSRQQLFLILYMDFLLHAAANAVIDLVRDADRMATDGTMTRRRFIFPGRRRLKKWLRGAFKVEDTNNEHAIDSYEEAIYTVSLGDAFKKRKNPEHLPPSNAFERLGQGVLKIVSILRSKEVAFGFRVACATMSIGIVAYLQATQAFFIQQRLVWAMIMVAISMTMTSGSGVFGFAARGFGTLLAMCSSLVIWYISGARGYPVGVLILMWCVIFVILYFLLNYPRFTPVCMITMVTHCLILGYELQVDKVGIDAQTITGQVYYPIFLLGPYRLATVVGGCAVAFIWTYFPYPLTAGNTLRRQLGETLYLLSNYYSVVHHSIQARLDSTGGNPKDKTSPNALLNRERNKLLGKLLAMQTQLRIHLSFIPLEFSFGGKFPTKEYAALVKSVNSLRDYISLLSYATRDYMHDPNGQNTQWLEDLNKIIAQLGGTSHEITKLLILLSSSLLDGQPLPPYLSPPKSFTLVKVLSDIDPEILSAKHFLEPGYASFAVAQVAGKLINDDLCSLLQHVKNLVGEIDFSFHVVSTANNSASRLTSHENREKVD